MAVIEFAALAVAVVATIAFAVVCVGIRRDDIASGPGAQPGRAVRLARRLTGMRSLPVHDRAAARKPSRSVKSRRDDQARCVVPAGRAAPGPGAARPAG